MRYGLPVHTFVLYMRGGPAGVRTGVHHEVSLGWEVCRFRSMSFGLSGASAEDYLARPEPLAWALAALMEWPGKDRFAQRRACLERIARKRNLDGARSFLLFNCVATYLELDGRAREEYEAILAEHGEENRDMAMTWAEKFEAQAVERGLQKGLQEGLQKGMQKGVQEGMREMLLHLLERRFSPPARGRTPAPLGHRFGRRADPAGREGPLGPVARRAGTGLRSGFRRLPSGILLN